MWVVSMSKQVKDILETHDTGCPHGITFAIHQDKDECIALFGRSGWPGLKPQFICWNESVETKQHTKLRNPYLMPMFVMLKKYRKILLSFNYCPFKRGRIIKNQLFPKWKQLKNQQAGHSCKTAN